MSQDPPIPSLSPLIRLPMLRAERGGERFVLRPHFRVGRMPASDLRFPKDDGVVSRDHASIDWVGDHWVVRDLGSKNGTVVNREPLGKSLQAPLREGSVVSFGDRDHTYIIEDASPPRLFAVAEDGRVAVARDHLLALPDDQAEVLHIYKDGRGDWVKADYTQDTVEPVEDGEAVTVAGERWTVSLLEQIPQTMAQVDETPTIDNISLRFEVSRDQEHIEVCIDSPAGQIDRYHRTFNEMLLMLAERRLADSADQTLPESEVGWIHLEDLAKACGQKGNKNAVHLWTFHARKHFDMAGIGDAARIVETRTRARSVRIGVATLEVRRA